MWTPEAAEAYNAYADEYAWDFKHFLAPGGYVNVPLDGLWLRAPYLHNGSVPYLTEILEPRERRTKMFYRGNDLYDPERMGFVSEGPEAERSGAHTTRPSPATATRDTSGARICLTLKSVSSWST